MTFNVWIYADHALLWAVREILSNFPQPKATADGRLIATGAVCVLAMQGALEAIVNRLFEAQQKMEHWDELRLRSKIDTLVQLEGKSISWDEYPWQEIARLIRLRNWLAHNKDPVIGLRNSAGYWIEGGIKGRIPRTDPERELSEDSVRSTYAAVREAAFQLAVAVGVEKDYEYLRTEEYRPCETG